MSSSCGGEGSKVFSLGQAFNGDAFLHPDQKEACLQLSKLPCSLQDLALIEI